ncbi:MULTISPECIES: DUF4136 domain-containing protein [Pacificimonas]|nr:MULTISPECIES: DUF4136 domain-containing protein [Pacificimonas]MBZ6377980.1 DUF4136 domain-containing protein [Pacificimonas aurantium]
MRSLPLILCAALAACSTYDPGIDVTRFHLEQPVARGAVFLEPAMPDQAGTLEFRTYADIVAAELRETGFTIVDDRDDAELLGVVDVAQASREALAQRSPVSIGVGGGTGGGNVGVGVGTTFGLGGGKSGEIVETLLALRLTRMSDESVIWEGRATTEAESGADRASAVAALPALADALLRDYPGMSGETVTYDE